MLTAPLQASDLQEHRLLLAVRHDIVDSNGKLTLRYNSRLHHIGLGRRHAGTRVLMVIKDLHVRIVRDDTKDVLRDFTLDPTKDYQPQPKT